MLDGDISLTWSRQSVANAKWVQWESIGVRFHARGDTIELASSMGCHHGNQSGEEAASD
ncbi:hypothetical protein [Paracidovorax avenae]|uniref:hypothetical protein n=1 Tax=Paracidovorax avenae TaxID=80867 RepID=UPI001CEF6A2F|nr:hypothetical protein [Paracidovorax avenae]